VLASVLVAAFCRSLVCFRSLFFCLFYRRRISFRNLTMSPLRADLTFIFIEIVFARLSLFLFLRSLVLCSCVQVSRSLFVIIYLPFALVMKLFFDWLSAVCVYSALGIYSDEIMDRMNATR